MGLDQARPLAQPLTAARRTPLFVVQFHAELGGKTFDRLGEGEVFDLLHKGDDIAALAAAETVPGPHCWANVKRRALLVMKGAQPLQRAGAGGAQGHVLAHDILNRGSFLDLCHVVSLDQTRHPASSTP